MITGRDLIIYILKNSLEDEPVFLENAFVGYCTMESCAQSFNVGVETVKAWIKTGVISGAVQIGDTYLIPKSDFIKPEVYLRKVLKGENDKND